MLGANDGIVSTAGLVVGVAGATSDRTAILVAGVAGLAAGALSMGAGEYVSVSTQRDSEHALLEKERRELAEEPEDELAELADIYVEKGLSEELALQVAARADRARRARRARRGRARHRPRRPHQPVDRGLGLDAVVHARRAAAAAHDRARSPPDVRVPVTVVAVVVALAFTGWASARFGYGPARQAVAPQHRRAGCSRCSATYADRRRWSAPRSC